MAFPFAPILIFLSILDSFSFVCEVRFIFFSVRIPPDGKVEPSYYSRDRSLFFQKRSLTKNGQALYPDKTWPQKCVNEKLFSLQRILFHQRIGIHFLFRDQEQ